MPLWAALTLGFLPSVVAIAAIVSAELRDRRGVQQERENRLRDERLAAYRKMLAATSTAHVDREGVEVLAETYAEISLLAGSYELSRAAKKVWIEYAKVRRIAAKMEKYPGENPEEASKDYALAIRKADTAQTQFLKLAREELGVEGRSPSFRDLEGSTPGEDLPGPETETSEP